MTLFFNIIVLYLNIDNIIIISNFNTHTHTYIVYTYTVHVFLVKY